MKTDAIQGLLKHAVETVTPAAQLVVRQNGVVQLEAAYGWLDPETRQQPAQVDTRFDMASVSKLFTVAAFMTLVEEGRVRLDQTVKTVLPDFDGLRPIQPYENPLKPGALVNVPGEVATADAGRVTFRQLLTHTSGLPAWRPLWQQANAEAARRMALETFFSYPTGNRIVYSDVGLILLGMSIETLTGQGLDAAIHDRVILPLGLAHTGFRPLPEATQRSAANIAPTEFCAWRGRRIVGEVHDENAWQLGGIAGHAGIFSTAADIAAFGQCFLDGGAPLLKQATVAEMTRIQAETEGVRRGLGFALWSADPEASSNPFSQRVFGHTGFTGTCLWIDPERELVVAFLTNEVYRGREGRGIGPLRVAVHRSIVEEALPPDAADFRTGARLP
ncbi:MAG: serine hydrolase domain-containing protein [Anaerolineae bacterium]|jgi:CubicO group peptidase (beta-lactamase class C family)|nr:serine hydrolase domain-containing protein [Anaerolineae bacterium]